MKRFIITVTQGDESWKIKLFAESSADALVKSMALKSIKTTGAKVIVEHDTEFNYNISEAG
jgi:hypothetical protein